VPDRPTPGERHRQHLSARPEILTGRDAGWQVQRRSGGEVARGEIYRRFVPVTLCGLAIGLIACAASLPLLFWMSPVILGMVLSIPLAITTSSPSKGQDLLATPEDRSPPAVVVRANQLAAGSRMSIAGALHELSTNSELRACHFANLSEPVRQRSGAIDVALATARAKVEACERREEAVSWLEKAETRAVLAHRVWSIAYCICPLRSVGQTAMAKAVVARGWVCPENQNCRMNSICLRFQIFSNNS
jgi:membrane glycosyltransferase